MAVRTDKATGDIVISGFEKGIAPSPHSGTAHIKNANISTETGELMASFSRVQQSQVTESGTLTHFSTSALAVGATSPLAIGTWISVSGSTISGLSNGTYYVISKAGTGQFGAVVQLSTIYSTNSADIISGFGGSGTATFSTLFAMARAIQSAIEPYHDTSGTQQYRYYILDVNGRVWIHDTQTYSGLDSALWALPSTNGMSSYGGGTPGGIGVLNGWLIITGGDHIFTKSTSQLGTDPTLEFLGSVNASTMSTGTTTNPQTVLVGHQGRGYYTDGTYIGSIFPDTSLLTAVNNVQSYCSYTASTVTGTITAIIGGSLPYTLKADGVTIQRIPVVFFPSSTGAQPTNLNAGQIYWLEYDLLTETFKVYDIESGNDSVIATGAFSMGDTSGTLTANWPYPSGAYSTIFGAPDSETKSVTYTYGSAHISWSGGLSDIAPAALTIDVDGGIALNIAQGATGTQYFNTFFPQSVSAAATITFTRQRVNLPYFEVATALGEIGNTVIIGTKSNSIYPWNQIDATPSSLISLPENNTQYILTVNQMAYIFAGNKGNIYITDGSVASLVIKVPDYCAGIPGSPATYIEPYFSWGGPMYLRGRVYFSILDQTSTKVGNCGGVWSFVPTQNLYIGQDTGLALRLENVNSYGTYNGVATVLIPNQQQSGIGPLYWSAWYSHITSPLYGIDYTNTTPGYPPFANRSTGNYNTIFETDLVPIATMLQKYTPTQVEYKLSSPLIAGESVDIAYRVNATDAYISMGTANIETASDFSGYFTSNFENAQWAQFQVTLIPHDSANDGIQSGFLRTVEIRMRQTP